MLKWIHRLINPHCLECAKEENKHYDLLMTLLESEKRHTENIIKAFTTSDEVKEDSVKPEYKPVGGVKLWDDQRRILEMAAHKKLLEENERANEIIVKKNYTTEELEEQLLEAEQ